MVKNRYFLHVDRKKANHAGSKAVDDAEKILELNGYEKICLYSPNNSRLRKALQWAKEYLRIRMLPVNSTLVIQHPLYIHKEYLRVLKNIRKNRKVKLVFLIHDLESVRHSLPDSEIYEKRDFEMFKIADTIICHNKHMHEWLVKNGVMDRRIIDLEIFDYLIDDQSVSEEIVKENCEPFEDGIVVAGNLATGTCGYLYRMTEDRSVKLNLYGVNYEKQKEQENIRYIGSFLPDMLPRIIKGKYGLVWYGNTTSKDASGKEYYEQYINPHKVSLYIVSGIPIIIWSKTGIADFIVEHKLGMAVDSLDGISEKLLSVSDEEYEVMKTNAGQVAEKLIKGGYLTEALRKSEKALRSFKVQTD